MKAFIGLLMWFGDLACVRAVAGGSIEDSSDPFPGVLFPEEAGEWLVNAEESEAKLCGIPNGILPRMLDGVNGEVDNVGITGLGLLISSLFTFVRFNGQSAVFSGFGFGVAAANEAARFCCSSEGIPAPMIPLPSKCS